MAQLLNLECLRRLLVITDDLHDGDCSRLGRFPNRRNFFTFSVFIHADAVHLSEGSVPHVKPHDTKILIVEDEYVVSLDIQNILQGMGIAVTGIARSVEDAIDLIERDRPHLVLLDISLSGEFEGVELARIIDRRWGIPVLFISGHLSHQAVKGLDELNALGYIVKPFYPVNLREAVESAISDLPVR